LFEPSVSFLFKAFAPIDATPVMASEEACFAFFLMLDLTFSPFRTSSAKFAAPLIAAFFTVRRMLCPVSLFASFIALGTSFFAPCARSFPNHLIKMLKK
jgi:hypothetical protein